MLKDKLSVSVGSVIGFEHKRLGKNNQDGVCVEMTEKILTAVVCDGCSSSRDSEVGAKILARFVAKELLHLASLTKLKDVQEVFLELERRIILYIKNIVSEFKDSQRAVDEMFLATIVGAVIDEMNTIVFSFGDGVISLNGEVEAIDEDNQPSYIGYKVYENYDVDTTDMNFIIRKEFPTEDLKILVIATDGAEELERKSENTIEVLGKKQTIGGLNQFEDGKYLKNPSLLQKRLFQLNMDKVHIDWEGKTMRKSTGVLSDDTSIVLIKRR